MKFPEDNIPNIKNKFPHVYMRLDALWQDQDMFEKYLQSLLTESERFDRAGFPEDVFKELWYLLNVVDYMNRNKPKDPWSKSFLK
jgi:hypothetical protein